MNPGPILIIEDDHDIRETCKQILEMEGYAVKTAANGRLGLELLQRGEDAKPCLILLDLMMPVMNGWEFLKARGQDDSIKSIPVVVVTAAGQSVGTFPDSSVQGLLKKPLELDALLKIVSRYCDVA